MATTRPTLQDILSSIQAWDGTLQDNLEVLFEGPIPIWEHTGTEANLAATFPVATHGNCLIWVNHSTFGWTLYFCDANVGWRPFRTKRPHTFVSVTTSQTLDHDFVIFTGAGSVDFDFLPASSWAGLTVEVRNDTAGNVNLDPNGSQQINNSSSSLVLPATKTARIYSTGSALFASIMD